MKLDRNINPDGKGKYALLNLRKNTVEWGTEPEGQFFVIKYKDFFAVPALKAYAKAVLAEAERLTASGWHSQAKELYEFALEMESEVQLAMNYNSKKVPS